MIFRQNKKLLSGLALAVGLFLQGCSDATKLGDALSSFGDSMNFGNIGANQVNVSWSAPSTLKGAPPTYDFRVVGGTAAQLASVNNPTSANAITNEDPTVGPFVVVDWTPNTSLSYDSELEKYIVSASGLEANTQYYFAVFYRDYVSGCVETLKGEPLPCAEPEILELRNVTTLTDDAPVLGKYSFNINNLEVDDDDGTVALDLNWTQASIPLEDKGPAPAVVEYKVVKASAANLIDTVALANAISGEGIVTADEGDAEGWKRADELIGPIAARVGPSSLSVGVNGLQPDEKVFFAVLARVNTNDSYSGLTLYSPTSIGKPGLSLDSPENATIDNGNVNNFVISGYCEFPGVEVNLVVGGNQLSTDCFYNLPRHSNKGLSGYFEITVDLSNDVNGLNIADGTVTVTATHSILGVTSTETDTFVKNTVVPDVTIDALAPISTGNQASYDVTGTCEIEGNPVYLSYNSGEVSLRGGPSSTCTNGIWSITGLDLSGFPDGTIYFTAYHSNDYNEGSTQASAIKTTSR